MSAPDVCLQIDVGNSSAKWRLVDAGQVVCRGRYVPGEVDSQEALLGCTESVSRVLVSSVADPEAERELAALLGDRWGVAPWFARTPARTGTLVNSYAEPGRMGVDRWLAMLAARQRCSERVCVVDAGSALTIDLVCASGEHEGGYIIPGPALMERALLLDTDRVRFAGQQDYALEPGNSTAAAVRHGVALSQVGAVSLALAVAGDPSPSLFFCGGGGEELMKLLGLGGSLVADLVFEGLEIMSVGQQAP